MSYYAEQAEARMESLIAEENAEIMQHENSARWRLTKRINCLESQIKQLTDRVNLLLSINAAEAKIKSKIERVRDWPWEANDE
jgi:hypothetical protein